MVTIEDFVKSRSFNYLYGLIQTDGALGKRKHIIRIELRLSDRVLLENIGDVVPFRTKLRNRVRDTNFKYNYESSTLSLNRKELTDFCTSIGLPRGYKSETIFVPNHLKHDPDYYRGLVDGDGSLGITSRNIPFLSLTTSSDDIATHYLTLISEITNKPLKISNRNKRDNVYNIMITREDAKKMASFLYYPECLSLPRKYHKAQEILSWIRPEYMRRRTYHARRWSEEEDRFILTNSLDQSVKFTGRKPTSIRDRLRKLSPGWLKHRNFVVKRWSEEEDNFILNHTLEQSLEFTGRTKKSIDTRLWRLNKLSTIP